MRKGMLVAVLVVLAVALAVAQGAPYFWTLVVRTALTNNGTLAQIGASTFTAAATFNGGTAVNGKEVVSDSLRVSKTVTFQDSLRFGADGKCVLYVRDGGTNADTLRIRYGNGTTKDLAP